MVEGLLLLLTGGAMSLGCVHSWRYLRRVRQAGEGDRTAREWVLARYRCGVNGANEPLHCGDADHRD